MESREQTQATVRSLLDKIIQFNMSKRKEYYNLCFDIQKNNGINDYIDMLSHMEKCCGTLSDNDEVLNELSDTDLVTVEQYLKSTADFMKLSTNDINSIQNETGYNIIEADFSFIDYFDFPINPLELLRLFYEFQRRNRSHSLDPRQLLPQGEYDQMSVQRHWDVLNARVREGERIGGKTKGLIARELREKIRESKKLDELFAFDKPFMNVRLRNFLNVNDDGEDCYTLQDMHKPGWKEENSMGSAYHQSTASDSRGSIFKWYNRLNAKFINTDDGREAVFKYPGDHINEGPDKGTFNYVNALKPAFKPELKFEHWQYDVDPFKDYPPEGYIESTTSRYNIGVFGNKHYWRY